MSGNETLSEETPAAEGAEEAVTSPTDEILELNELAGVASTRRGATLILHPSRSQYVAAVEALRQAGFALCSDLCAVDYLEQPARDLPSEVGPERFEVVVHLTSLSLARRVRIRLQVPADEPRAPSLFGSYPGTEAMEREAFDMYGIVFDGHPDLTRILMPEDWEGHPLRKDYSVGRVPVQFKEAPGPR